MGFFVLTVFFTAVSSSAEDSNVSLLTTNPLCPRGCGQFPVLLVRAWDPGKYSIASPGQNLLFPSIYLPALSPQGAS